MIKRLLLPQVAVASFTLLVAGSLEADTVVHEFGDLSAITQDFTIDLTTADESTSDLVYSVASTTVGGEAFTYTFTIAAGTGVADLTTASPNAGQTGSTSNRFDHNDQIILTVSSISNANVVFDGYVGYGVNFNGADLGFNIGGIDYLQGSGSDPRFGDAPDSIISSTSTTVTYLNNADNGALAGNIRGVALQFSSIPEPSTFALFGGLLALSCVAIRRRR